MADYAALRDAEQLRDEAAALLAAIGREIALLEAALAAARDGVAQAEKTARNNGEHVAWLEDQLELRRVLARQAVERLAQGAAARREMAVLSGAELERMPAGVGGAAPGSARARRVTAPLPMFRPVTRARLKEVPLPSFPVMDSVWERLAVEVPALGDRVETAYRVLDEAETAARASLERAASKKLAEAQRATRRQEWRSQKDHG
jgi:hypothetical protein